MKKLVMAAVAAAVLPVSVQAKTVCISLFNGFGEMKFTVKSLKKPGNYSPIVGFYQEKATGFLSSIEGSAVVLGDGSIRFGVQLQSMTDPTLLRQFLLSGTFPDATFVGTMSYDNNGDGVANGSTNTAVMNCKDVTVEPPVI